MIKSISKIVDGRKWVYTTVTPPKIKLYWSNLNSPNVWSGSDVVRCSFNKNKNTERPCEAIAKTLVGSRPACKIHGR